MIRLLNSYAQRYSHEQAILQWAGIVGVVGFPLFHVVYTQFIVQTYENFLIRCVAMVLCAGMAIRRYWPKSLLKYYSRYSYVCLIYCLPFFHVFMTLKNDGGIAFISDSLMALSFLVLLMDWRNTLFMTVIGAALGWLVYWMTTDIPVWPREYVARLPTMVLILVGGNLFKLSERHLEAERIKARTVQARLDAQTALAGSIAHEMRNPLSQVGYSLERISEALPEPTPTRGAKGLAVTELDALYRYVAQGRVAIERGLQVIEMTLDAVQSKPLDTETFVYLSAGDVTRKAVEEYSFENEAERQRVHVVIRQDFRFKGDETVYLFVLFNLLKNALYYFRAHPAATITLTVDHQAVTVRDTGPGIPVAQQPVLFEAFRSVGKTGGTGLGLAYCQRAMHAFGGRIDCASVEGEFTEFCLRFPAVSAEELHAHERMVLDDAAPKFKGKQILLVDDEPYLRMLPRQVLSELGAHVMEADTGLEAVEKASQTSFDLIVMDLNMPVLDGYAATEHIRAAAAGRYRSVPIVAYTSESSYIAKEKTQKAGMTAFVSKPCTAVELVKTLQLAMEQAVSEYSPAALREKLILVADDETFNRQAVRRYLEDAGAFVVEAENGVHALECIASASPPVEAVLLDLHMPQMDGLATTHEIRTRDWLFRDLPIIAVTGFADDARREAARAAGVSEVLVKPVGADALVLALSRCMTSSGTQHGSYQGSPAVACVASPAATAKEDVPPGSANDEALQWVDMAQLNQFRQYNALDDLAGILETIDSRMQTVRSGATARNLGEVREALHSMLGLYGLIGADPARRCIRQFYVSIENDQAWPADASWVEKIDALLVQTREEVEAYLHKHVTCS